jgi:hypothetical protein
MASDSSLSRSPSPIRSITPLAIPAERVLSKELTEKLHNSPTTTNVKNAFAFGPIKAFNFENLDIITTEDDSKQVIHIIAENHDEDHHRHHHRKPKRNRHTSTRSTMETLYKDMIYKHKELHHHHPHNLHYKLSDKLTEKQKDAIILLHSEAKDIVKTIMNTSVISLPIRIFELLIEIVKLIETITINEKIIEHADKKLIILELVRLLLYDFVEDNSDIINVFNVLAGPILSLLLVNITRTEESVIIHLNEVENEIESTCSSLFCGMGGSMA